jgi:homoserine dehydrogenase
MKTYNLCFAGFGNVGRALAALLEKKKDELRERYGIEWRITGIASRRLGWLVDPQGFPVDRLLSGNNLIGERSAHDIGDWLKAAQADVFFEMTSLNRQSGEPAISHLRAALEHGAHCISANKGPVIYAYEDLRHLANTKGRRFLFESTVMDGVPIFAMFRDSLPALHVRGFRAILNSTTNVVLDQIEQGLGLDQAIRKAQELGVAETDPSDDLEGWDSAVKVAALVIVVLGVPIKLGEIKRQGISSLSPDAIRAARQAGRPYKLICRAQRKENGKVQASVRPEQLDSGDPLAFVNGTSSAIYFESDIFPGLAITELNPGIEATAYGLLADFVTAVS